MKSAAIPDIVRERSCVSVRLIIQCKLLHTGITLRLLQVLEQRCKVFCKFLRIICSGNPVGTIIRKEMTAEIAERNIICRNMTAPQHQCHIRTCFFSQIQDCIQGLHLLIFKCESIPVIAGWIVIIIVWFPPVRKNHHTISVNSDIPATFHNRTFPIQLGRPITPGDILTQEMRIELDSKTKKFHPR